MKFTIRDNLPFITIQVAYQGNIIEIPDVLIDTGSSNTILSIEILSRIGIIPAQQDILQMVQGIGGTEVVFIRQVERLQCDNMQVSPFEIEVGGMDYGFPINGILGMDFLLRTKAKLDFESCQIKE